MKNKEIQLEALKILEQEASGLIEAEYYIFCYAPPYKTGGEFLPPPISLSAFVDGKMIDLKTGKKMMVKADMIEVINKIGKPEITGIFDMSEEGDCLDLKAQGFTVYNEEEMRELIDL